MRETAKYMDQEALAKLLCVDVRTVQRWRISGDGPAFIRCGARRVIYEIKAVEAWTAANTFTSRADELQRAG
jgi:hypothetical protein